MATAGTYEVATGAPVAWPLAVVRWKDAARPVLIDVARHYGAYVSYGELGERVQASTGVRTTSLVTNWIGEVLAAVDLSQPPDEPLLSSFVVYADSEEVGPGYDEPVLRREGSRPDDRQWHAANERLQCHRHFGAELPADGGRPQLTRRVAGRRARGRVEVPAKTCPTCHLRLPASGLCDTCS